MSNYAESIARPPRTLTEREVALLLRTTGEHAAGWRDHVIFSLALGTALREHELLALDVGDVFDGGRARRRTVEIGQRNLTEAEVRAGLEAGMRVIRYPSNAVEEGVRVKARAA